MAEETGWAHRRGAGSRVFGLSASIPCHLPPPAQCPHPLSRTSASPAQGAPEFQDIVCGTDERPFPSDLLHPAQQELPIAAPLLDLTEHRFHDGFALSIEPSPTCGPEGAAHPVSH
jgi:hypothetical protein